MKQADKIRELEERVKQLEQAPRMYPVYVPYYVNPPTIQPIYVPSTPYVPWPGYPIYTLAGQTVTAASPTVATYQGSVTGTAVSISASDQMSNGISWS